MAGIGCLAVIAVIGCLVALGRLSESNATTAEFDGNTAVVSSCSFGEMLSITKDIPTISGLDAGKICETIAKSLSHRPPINVLRAAFKVVSLMSIRGPKGSESDIAYQLMNIVEARGITNPDRIVSTFNNVWRIFSDRWTRNATRFEHNATQRWTDGAHPVR